MHTDTRHLLNLPLQVKVKATELELYLSRKFAVELLHGDIAVKSVAGEGRTFTLSIARTLDGTVTDRKD